MCKKKKKILGALSVTSRRLFEPSLSRRDVEFQRRDVDFHNLLERRDVASKTWILMGLFHVATLPLNVATLLIPLSVTSRRCPERHDVAPNVATSFSSTLCNVATLPRMSRRYPVLRPRTVHFALHLAHTPTETLATLAHLSFPVLPELLSHRSEVPPLLSDHPCASQSHPLQLVPGHCGIPPHCTRLWHWFGLLGSLCIHSWSRDLLGPSLGYFSVLGS